MLKRLIAITVSLLMVIPLFSSCREQSNANNEKLQITATLFPHYEFAKAVAGEKADITMLLPPGTDSHMYDPTPADMAGIYKSDLFLYTGEDMEPWAQSIISSHSDSLLICDLSQNAELKHNEHALDLLVKEHDDCDHHEHDTHFWLDLDNSIKMVDSIKEALISLDSENSDYYTDNADNYKAELLKLKNEYEQVLSSPDAKTIVFGGKFSYYYLVDAFSLNYISAYDDCCSDSEPSVKRIVDIINYIKENDIKVIYHEELANPVIANQIAAETGVKPLLIHTCHNLSKEDMENGVSYLDLLSKNLENLKEGLE